MCGLMMSTLQNTALVGSGMKEGALRTGSLGNREPCPWGSGEINHIH